MEYNKKIASIIDHTLLKQDATKEEIKNICYDSIKYSFASVCINPIYVSFVKDLLKDSNVKVCTVVGFPLGNNLTSVKVFETEQALKDGADEIDMVVSISAIKNKDYEFIKNDIQSVLEACNSKVLKVIFETCLLTKDEKIELCKICKDLKVGYVKTSTGFSKSGATIEDIKLMKSIVKDEIGIKASGGIKDLKTTIDMISAGATRIGTSSGVSIIITH